MNFGHWLVARRFGETRVRIFDVSSLNSTTPPILTADRTASGAGDLLMLEPSSDGRRMVCVFANGFVQVVGSVTMNS